MALARPLKTLLFLPVFRREWPRVRSEWVGLITSTIRSSRRFDDSRLTPLSPHPVRSVTKSCGRSWRTPRRRAGNGRGAADLVGHGIRL